MSDARTKERAERGLILHIDNKEPISAALLGSLFTTLSNEYRAATGRDLVITSVREGTITTVLNDMLNGVEHANDLFEFAKNVGKLLKGALSGALPLWKTRKRGAKGAQAILDVAMTGGANVEFSYSNKDGEFLVAKVTRDEASRYHRRKSADKNLPSMAPPKSTPKDMLAAESARLVEDFTKTAVERYPDDPLLLTVGPEASDPLVHLLRTIIEGALETAHGRGVLADIARRLEERGFRAAADVIKEQLRRPTHP